MKDSVKSWVVLLAEQCEERCRDVAVYRLAGMPRLERGASGAAEMLSRMAFKSVAANAVSSSELGRVKRRGEAAALGLSL